MNKFTLIALIMLASLLHAETYYIDASSGSDNNDGKTEGAAWQNVSLIKNKNFVPGDEILLKRGEVWASTLNISSNGDASAPILFGAYGSGDEPQIFGVDISADFIIVENLLIDHNQEPSDCIELSRSENVILRNLEIRNGERDAIDGDKANNLLVENCTIHHFLNGTYSSQKDAHGIVLTDTKGITIKNTEIYQVSGDCVQTDPDRDTNTPDSLWIEDCTFWTGPLTEDFNSGWKAGNIPGENALDTKLVKDNWDAIDRMQVTIKNTTVFGFQNGNINNMAAFNLKEKIEAVLDGVTVYDCEIAFRMRGTRGNANVTIMNSVVYNCEKAFRAEDDVANLKLYNSTFGSGLQNTFTFAGGDGGIGSWEILNNAFWGSKPDLAADGSNQPAGVSDFEDSDNHDYRLKEGSLLIDGGTEIALVIMDKNGLSRPQGTQFDIGAYEFESIPTSIISAGLAGPEDYVLAQNYPNPFNPQTTIEFNIIQPSTVHLLIYSSTGQLVRELVNGSYLTGKYTVRWNATNNFGVKVAAGMYHYQLISAGKSETKKMLYLP
jgi:parallel beta helix pectate lyase-like protein/flagellar hook capping protein FlgD